MEFIDLLKTTDAEIKLGNNKLYWDKRTQEWVVRHRRTVTSLYTVILYEGKNKIEAVIALKWDGGKE